MHGTRGTFWQRRVSHRCALVYTDVGGYGILPYPRSLRNPVVSARLCRLLEQELHQQNMQGYLPQNARNTQNLLAEKHLPQIGTDAHRCRRVWHPAIPTQPQESSCLSSTLPPARARTAPTKQAGINPTERTEHTEVSCREESPTDSTDAHRLGGYGILPYPRSQQHPQTSVNSVNSVGEQTQPTICANP